MYPILILIHKKNVDEMFGNLRPWQTTRPFSLNVTTPNDAFLYFHTERLAASVVQKCTITLTEDVGC